MDDRGTLYENPTDEEILRLNLIRLPALEDQFVKGKIAELERQLKAERDRPLVPAHVGFKLKPGQIPIG